MQNINKRKTMIGHQFSISPSFSFGMSKGLHFSRTNGYELISKWISPMAPKPRENLWEERRLGDGGRSIPELPGCPPGIHLTHCTYEGGPSGSTFSGKRISRTSLSV